MKDFVMLAHNYVRPEVQRMAGTKIDSLLHGGHHERNRRAGTENIPGIVGLGKACEIAMKEQEKEEKETEGFKR
jgi:cysteine sulfinate desulfinase/cysteine desulfurase-like protein